ncbi:hypothetical protein CDL12_03390 [Handroanthus impetiginosus]|uniref:Uncharacterized protein n=1 Tax=Handroanthus impetiginosus TaxID=429701 RepID=A0A2G9I296_9LAMI|nr:hypothetical protein CDL12_03390 [Handroanthus impetiginosus]
MAPFLSRTLIRATASSSSCLSSAAAKPRAIRCFSTQAESGSVTELTVSEEEAMAVEKIEDAIHSIIVKRSKPDWLPLVPGASYWVPPRRSSYGVADVVHKLSNALTDEEHLSLITLQGWPSSAFYIYNDASASYLDLGGGEKSSTKTFAVKDCI